MKKCFYLSLAFILILFLSCNISTEKKELKHFPVDDLNGIVAQPRVQIDKSVSSDGNGSIKIEASEPVSVSLYVIDNIKVENTQIIYEAKLKSDGLSGQAFLEMWCVFRDQGKFFSRGFDSAIGGTTDWKTIKTVFNLKKGEMPDQIMLNVMINGVGTIWIDDILLSKL